MKLSIRDYRFRCSFRVGRKVLPAARLNSDPSGRAALLSASVKAYKPCHHERPDESPAFFAS